MLLGVKGVKRQNSKERLAAKTRLDVGGKRSGLPKRSENRNQGGKREKKAW